jgi:hypothetical protein
MCWCFNDDDLCFFSSSASSAITTKPTSSTTSTTNTSSLFANAAKVQKGGVLPPKKAGYTVCNGMSNHMSNQLIGHFTALSFALGGDGKTSVDMPDAYIINGLQTIVDGNMADVTPTLQNSVPIGKIFDITKLREHIKKANKNATVNVVPFDASLSCSGWLNRMQTTDPKAVQEVMRYIVVPSPLLQSVIDKGQSFPSDLKQ